MDTLRPFRGSIKLRSGVFRFYEPCPVAIARNNGAEVKTSVQILASGERMGERETADSIITALGNYCRFLSPGNELFIEVSVDIFIHLSSLSIQHTMGHRSIICECWALASIYYHLPREPVCTF